MQGGYIPLLLGLRRDGKRLSDPLQSFCPPSDQQAALSQQVHVARQIDFQAHLFQTDKFFLNKRDPHSIGLSPSKKHKCRGTELRKVMLLTQRQKLRPDMSQRWRVPQHLAELTTQRQSLCERWDMPQ